MDFDLLSNNAYRQITIFTIAFTTICFQRWIMLAVWREYLGYHCELVLLWINFPMQLVDRILLLDLTLD